MKTASDNPRPSLRATATGGPLLGAACGAAFVGAIAVIGFAAGVGQLVLWLLATLPTGATLAVLLASRARARTVERAENSLAVQDPVTGVANRAGLEQRLAAEVARARRHRLGFTVLRIDLDGFRQINDRAGRDAGDEVLRRVALGIAASLRGEDFVARWGGDEFAVVLPGATATDASRVASRVVAAAERVVLEGVHLPALTASVGSAAYPEDGVTVDDLLAAGAARLAEAQRQRAVVRAHLAAKLLPPRPAVTPSVPDRWPTGRALRLATALALAGVATWFASSLLAVGDVVRPGIVIAEVAVLCALGLDIARRTSGRERAGWLLVSLCGPVAFVPVVSGLSAIGFGCGLLLVAGDGWLRDRFRVLDAVSFVAIIAGGIAAFVAPHVEGLHLGTLDLLTEATMATAAVVLGAVAMLVLTGVGRRERPDAGLLAVAYASMVGAAVIYVWNARYPGLPSADWEACYPVAAAIAIAGAWLRRHGPSRPSRTLRRAEADAAAPVTVGTILLGALLVGVTATGMLPVAVVLSLLAALFIRHGRTRLVGHENRRLLRVALRSQAERAAQHRASLIALTTALEARDGYTGRHGDETVSLAIKVGDALGLDGEARAEVETVALLHDIGKIGTPNEILHKPGPLTDEEWVVMREHPVVGERILRTVPGLESVARAVRHEHERWDGAGYPDGLEGEAIPLPSRIVLVCDAFHAMTSDRPYRNAMDVEDALAELERNAGTQFDPAVVHAMVAVLAGESAVERQNALV